MTPPGLYSIVTTIQEPTPAIRSLCARLQADGAALIVIGDKKGPARFELPGARFVPLAGQTALPFALAPLLPTGHYVRKNLGYLIAMAEGAPCIYETDDDNQPLSHWAPRALNVSARVATAKGWYNVYGAFSDAVIWPRGFPLERCREPIVRPGGDPVGCDSAIQQGLADIAPDVDAAWRLMVGAEPFHFSAGPSVNLAPGAWCPFNSQSTWFWPVAYPLMYLPSTCTFRMTDIWRSFVAQRCLWEIGQGVTFHAPEVQQERNPHDYLKDFEEEIPGYLKNHQIARILESLSLKSGPGAVGDNLVKCYEALVEREILRPTELDLLRAWMRDLDGIRSA